MASTNKTTHYELSQYVGSDKPTYLTDYNNDMSAIDTGIYNAQTKADSAYTLADTANGNAGTAQTTANSAVTSAGTANTNIGTMANLTTTEKSTLVGAVNEVNYNVGLFNLTTFETPTSSSVSAGEIISNDLHVAKNANGSIAKVYGSLAIRNIPTNTDYVDTTFQTTLRPASDINISDMNIYLHYGNNTGTSVGITGISISTSGVVSIRTWINTTSTAIDMHLIPIVIWVKDFGDAPSPAPSN